jgi:DnaJ-class molecular chaperone
MTIPAHKDYYKILGVHENASQQEIRSAYRDLARKYHPDVNAGNKQAAARFKEIHEAYAVLAEPKKRRQYDALGSAGPKRPQQGHRPGSAARTHTTGATTSDASDIHTPPLGRAHSGGTARGGLDLGVIRISIGVKTVDDLLAGLDRTLRGPADE